MALIVRCIAAMAVGWLAAACEGTQVIEAHCSACDTRVYTAEDCARFGAAAGCESATYTDDVPRNCNGGCTFSDCDRTPECAVLVRPGADAETEGEDAETPNNPGS